MTPSEAEVEQKPADENKAPAEENKAVVQTTAGALTVEEMAAYGVDAGVGYDNQTGEDVGIPFIKLLQPGSPEAQVEGSAARPGMWLNVGSGALAGSAEGISFVPCYTEHLMVEWKDREKGGGFIARHPIDGDLAKRVRAEQEFGEYKHPDNPDHDLVDTFYVYGLVLDADGNPAPATLSFSSTFIKAYKFWSYKMRSVVIPLPDGRKLTGLNLPMFAFCWRLTTKKVEKNGNTWWVPEVGWAGKDAMDSRVPPGAELYAMAKGVYEAVKTGALKANEATLEREAAGEGDAAPKGKGAAKAPY